MNKINSVYLKRIVKYFSVLIISSNYLLGNGDYSTYFERTIAYFRVQNGIIDPFYEDIKNLSLSSEHQLSYFYSINPVNLLKKLKYDTKPGLNNNTFVYLEQYDEQNIRMPSVVSVDYYTFHRITNNNNEMFTEEILDNFRDNNSSISNSSRAISLVNSNIGNTNVQIKLKGSIQISGELEFLDQQGGNISQQGDNWNLDIDQKQNFDLEGTVGDRFTVSADQNSESDFDWENSLLLEYKGKSNEIIDAINVGNINLNLPHTQLVSVGMGKREGLFGVKMNSSFGNLHLSTIYGIEKVKKESFSLGEQADGLIRYDYQFIRDKYFFINEVFKLFYYPLDGENRHMTNSDYYILSKDNDQIPQFHVYKRSKSNEIVPGTYNGIAYLDPTDPDNSYSEPGYWIKLEEGSDYGINYGTGVIRLNSPNSSDVVAVHYKIGRYNPSTHLAEYVDDAYNATGTDVSAINEDADICLDQIDFCTNDNLNVCEEGNIEDVNFSCLNQNDSIVSEITIEDDCVSQYWDLGACYSSINNEELEDYITEELCTALTENTYSWEPNCDYIDNNNNNEYDENKIILKLIKTGEQQNSTSQTWNLMLKNIYSIGLSNINDNIREENPPELQIIHVGGQLGTETASSNGNTFLNIFGIDKMDVNKNEVSGGDGKVDAVFTSIINGYGDLVLPFHLPFSYDQSDPFLIRNSGGEDFGSIWGNSHQDLNTIFDGDLNISDMETKYITFDYFGENSDYQSITLDVPEFNSGPAMYFSNSQTQVESEREFAINVKNVNQNSTINLGFMIVENSETITDGNSVLTKGLDYTIDYFSGTLTLISDRAKNSRESITVSYDRNEIISFDKKTIFGNYFKYDFSENSNLFGGAYFYTQEISTKKVEIGYEPMENFIWHIGGKYTHEFDNLDDRINSNTYLNIDKQSKFEVIAEYAEINPNPNPLGVAYIDDFESSDNGASIFERFGAWKLSSPPLNSVFSEDGTLISNDLYDKKKRLKMFWFNPYNDISTKSIWPDMKVENNSKESTLWLELPNCTDSASDFNIFNCGNENEEWWAGVTTYLHSSEYDQSDKKYLDIWINTDGHSGVSSGIKSDELFMHIDLGEISEDINLNLISDTEDSNIIDDEGNVQRGNGIFDEGEDVGIDGCTDEYEDGWGGCMCKQYKHYNSSGNPYPFFECEILSSDLDYNIHADPSDRNGDNFDCSYNYNQSYPDYSFINGLQGNSCNNLPEINSEDFDGDGFTDAINSYFTYEVDLMNDDEQDIIYTENYKNWKLYRIPLSEFSVNTENQEDQPTWERITNVRLWFSGSGNISPKSEDATINGKVGIASIELVGNKWVSLGNVANQDIVLAGYQEENYSNENENILIEVINNHEHENYIEPEGVEIENNIDVTTNEEIEEKEQSLVIDFNYDELCYGECGNDLACLETCGGILSEQSAFIKRGLNYSSLDAEKQNSFFAYKNMEMFFKPNRADLINSGSENISWQGIETCEDNVELAFRIGKDDNYYEIRQPLNQGSLDGCTDDPISGDGLCDSEWENMNIDLDELTRYKKNRDGLSYPVNGIDGCSDEYETGVFKVVNDLVIPECLEEGSGLTFTNICNALEIESYCEEDNLSATITINTIEYECSELKNMIDVDICSNELLFDFYLDNKKHYIPNKFDPNGDNFLMPGEDCCLDSNTCSVIDDNGYQLMCSSYRPGKDCVEDISAEECTSLIECPNLSEIYQSLDNSLKFNNELSCDIPNNTNLHYYIGTEDNYQYDCYSYNDNTWDICELESYENYSISDSQNSCEDYYLTGELIKEFSGAYVSYIPPANQDYQNDVWTWRENLDDSEQSSEIINLTNVCGDCTELSIKGEPAINRMEYVIVGVVNNTDHSIYGNVWINELRLTGVKKERGTAFLANMKFNLGNIFNIDLSYSQKEANYHKLEKRLGTGSNEIKYTTNIGIKPSKLFEENYFDMPLNLKYTKRISSPMYKTGSDIFLGTDIDSAPEDEKSSSNTLNFSTHIKTNLSDYYEDNILYSYIFDKSIINYSYSHSESSSPIILSKVLISKDISYKYNITYSKENYWEPFKKIFSNESWENDTKNYPIKFLENIRIYYLPKDLQLNVSYSDDDNYTEQRQKFGGTITDETNINLYRVFKTSYNLAENIVINYKVEMRNNLNDYNNQHLLDVSNLFDFNFSPGIKKSYNEHYTFTYTPNILDWLSPRFTYNPRYDWTLESSSEQSANIKSTNDFSASFSFSFQKLVEKFYKVESTGSSSRRGRNSRYKKSSNNQDEGSKYFIIDQPHFKTILKFLHSISKKISTISINYKYNTKNTYNNIVSNIEPDYLFKLGINQLPFNDDGNFYSESGIISSYSNSFYQELRMNTSLQITNNFSFSNLEYKISISASNQSISGYNENTSYSFFPIGARGEDGIPMLNWSINLKGIEKYWFLKNWFKSITVNHNYIGERTETVQETIVQKIDFKRSFTPMVGIKMTPKNLPVNINCNVNNILTINNTGEQTERKTSKQINIKLDYRKKTGFRIPVFFLRDFEIENEVNLSLTMGYDDSVTDFSYVITNDINNFQRTAFTNSYNIKPEITYSFSKYVDGNFYINHSISKTHTTGRKKETDIGFRVRIIFESFN